MPVTYPRLLSDLRDLIAYSPEPMVRRSVATASMPGGISVLETSDAIWTARWRTHALNQAERRRVEAWLDSLAGARSFLTFFPGKCWPIAHPGGQITGTWSDTLAVTIVEPTVVTATAPNAALRLKAGDLVSLEQSGRHQLLRVMADCQPAGGVIEVDVAPRPAQGLFGAGALLRLKEPRCEMILDPSQPAEPADGILAPMSFAGIQKVM